MNTVLRSLLCIGLAASIGSAQESADARTPTPFSITIEPNSHQVKVGLPVDIKVRLTNTSTHDMPAGLGPWVMGGIDPMYVYICRDERGMLVARDYPVLGSLGDKATTRTLKPHMSEEEQVTVSTACNFSRPGHYEIQLSRNASAGAKDGVVKSNTIALTVVPPLFSILISIQNRQVKAGSPIPLGIRLKNLSTEGAALGGPVQPMTVDPRYGYFCYNSKGLVVSNGPVSLPPQQRPSLCPVQPSTRWLQLARPVT